MAFEGLSSKLSSALSKLTSRGKLTEQAVKEGMRDVRMALLEADVNYLVVKDFVKKVTERAIGADILASLTPGQQARAANAHHLGGGQIIAVAQTLNFTPRLTRVGRPGG